MNVSEILKVLEQRVKIDLPKENNLPNYTLCVDGTSATGKTTILRRSGLPTSKVQELATFVNSDSYFPSMLGYISTGLLAQMSSPWRLNDRSPLNCLEWCVFWNLAQTLISRHGIDAGYRNDKFEDHEFIVKTFENLGKSYYYSSLRERINGLALIDSNVDRCNNRRRNRECRTENDLLRSNWCWYTPLQNIMYSTLYPDSHIDLAWFNEESNEILLDAIILFLQKTMKKLQDNSKKLHLDTQMPFHPKLPANETDYLLKNLTVHADRNYARVFCKKIYDDKIDFVQTYRTNIPDFLNTWTNDSQELSIARYTDCNNND